MKSLPQSFLITLVPELTLLIPNPKEANVLLIQTKFKNLVFQNKIDIWRVFIKLLQIEFREIECIYLVYFQVQIVYDVVLCKDLKEV